MSKTIYYLPGRGGRIATGLGEGLLNRGFDVTGRETVGEFRSRVFQEQVDIVANDLTTDFWNKDARVVANSFGAYLFLHAQAQIESYVGNVLLLSPIVGECSNEETLVNFIPPRAGKLQEMAQSGAYPAPQNCEIHVGEQDWQSVPTNVIALAQQLGLSVTVVPGAGHVLGTDYVTSVLDKWLR
ncbi:MAG TPA: alpha/beta hydrolase [Burkholderiaceae bacterium]|nr:alpha/beta hydrolase [Burkholderiaceae bacterium]